MLFFICVTGFVLQVQRARTDVEGLTQPIVRAIIIVGLIATLPYWFGWSEKMFLGIADTIQTGYTDHPMRVAQQLRATVGDSGSDFSLRRIGESVYKASLYAAVKVVVLVGSLLQLPFLVLQYVLKLLCYLFLPVALGMGMIPSLAPLGAKYIQQTLAVLAWPVGFAVTELVAYHLLTAYQNNLAAAYDLVPGQIDAASFASLLGGLLAALWIIVGTLGTPVLMQMLFCSGSPLSGGSQSAMQQISSIQQLALVVKSLKTGGIAAPLAAASMAGKSGGGGGSQPPPPSPSVRPPAPTAAPQSDPTGEIRAKAVMAQNQLPGPQTTI
ncbi:MAG TPA: hypothetical protein VL200_00960 [Lacunisphaera sp.]|nr:hypothetical protein [Lacunisphaera sp.]